MKLSRVYARHKNVPEVVLALASFHDDYSFTGILDDEREKENRTRALALFEEYLEMHPSDGVVRTRYGRLMLRMGNTDGAIECFKQAFQNEHTSTRASWLAEAYFRAGRFSELRRFAVEVANYPELMNKMEASVQHSMRSWMGVHHKQGSA